MSTGRTVALLGTAQTLAWASSYYLPAILATPIARDLGTTPTFVFAAFSAALLVSASVGPWAGRWIDGRGGRGLLMVTNALFAAALTTLGFAQNVVVLFAAWVLMGIAMGSGLYEAAFATSVRIHGQGSRSTITGITLVAGFASTIGWPLTAWLEARYGWRGACFGWAALHLLVGLPLHASLPRALRASIASSDVSTHVAAETPATPPRRSAGVTSALLALVFAVAWFISTAMAAHLPRLLEAAGVSLAVAVGIGALVGPAQVAGRLFEYGFMRRAHPLLSARLAALAHPMAAAGLLIGGSFFAPVFAVLHGVGNGILTIAMGTLPLALFGAHGYGARQGWLMLPARVVQALAPYLFGLALDQLGASVLWLSIALGLVGFAALMALR